MALTLSGTNGVVGAGFTLDASGASVTAGVGTFSSLQGSAANLTQIPAANIVGVCTSGLTKTGGFGGGKILQVLQTVKTDVSSRGGSSGTDALAAISGLSVNITPSATSSKIHVVVNIKQGSSSTAWVRYQLQRDSTAIYLGDAASGKTPRTNFTYLGNDYGLSTVSENFLDSPNTTSQITYQVYWGVRTESGKIAYINRTGYDTGDYAERTASSITAMEIEA